jgi:hypothetical protein
VNDSIRLNTLAASSAALDTRITNDSTRLNGLESDVNTRIVNDSIRLNTLAASSAALDTRITNDSTRLNTAVAKAISDSTVLHSALNDTALAIRSDFLWSEIATGINYSSTGRVGIGAAVPSAKLDVRSGTLTNAIFAISTGSGENTGLFARSESNGNNNNQYGIQAIASGLNGATTGTGTGNHVGVNGSADGSGVYSAGLVGYAKSLHTGALATENWSRGVDGQARSTIAKYNQGVNGSADIANSNTTGHNAGVVGSASGHTLNNYGFLSLIGASGANNYGSANFSFGIATGAKRNVGVFAYADNATTNIGVYADVTASTSGTNYGIYSDAGSGTNDLAGFFDGDVTITGDLDITGAISKGSGTFKIDHPLDPENKYLVHSFVESPDMMNVYNGNITTDANGLATVELPQYVQVSNKDFRYQLTPIGQFAQCIVKEEVNGDKFIIQTDIPNVKVSWQVTGIRNDPYAKENRVIVEEEKTSQEKGKYLHPAVYGLDETQSVHTRVKNITEDEVQEMKGATGSPNSDKR